MTKNTARYRTLCARGLCPSCAAPRFRDYVRCAECLFAQRVKAAARNRARQQGKAA